MEKLDSATISAIAAALGAFVSACVLGLSIYQARRQDDLLKRTSELEVDVNRISVHLRESLDLLHDARRQVLTLLHLFIVTRSASTRNVENMASLLTHVVNLEALLKVVGNEKVNKTWREGISPVFLGLDDATPDELSEIMMTDLADQIAKLLEGIYEMIRDATNRSENL